MKPAAVELPSDYYLTNFVALLNHVFHFYQDLLTASEINFYHQFHHLMHDSQCLYVRMLMRSGEYYRQEKLYYKEIRDTQQCLGDLAAANFIQIPQSLTVENLLPLYTKQEWTTYLHSEQPDLRISNKLSRDKLWQLVSAKLPPIIRPFSPVVQLLKTQLFTVFQLLYFGNLRQDLREFVLSDLGVKQFPNYSLGLRCRRFQTRQEVDRYLEVEQLASALAELNKMEITQLLDHYQTLSRYTDDGSAHLSKVKSLLFKLARQIERLDPLKAAPLYQTIDCDQSFERLIRILGNQGDLQYALELCQTRSTKAIGAELDLFIYSFGQKLAKQLGRLVPTTRTPPKPDVLILQKNAECIEHIAAIHLTNQGETFFVQNELFTCLFSLVYWPVIYANVKGAFSHPYQHRPLDLYSEEFLIKRADIISQINQQFFSESPTLATATQFDQINRLQSALGPWPNLNLNIINRAIEVIPKQHFHLIFSRMWSDLRYCRNGFPDLIQFKHDGNYELIEIKGPGDTLQRNQTLWLRYFVQHQIPARVLRVEWADTCQP